MIERWSIDKCHTIRLLLNVSAKEVGSRVFMTRQTINNIEAGRGLGSEANTRKLEILYTLALKDILEERGITIEELVQKQIEGLKSL